ncbi:hypothetical protein ABZP36_001725 [Zizania latifolia]
MAIKGHYSPADIVTMEEFKQWIKAFDTNNDSRISRSELVRAMHNKGCWFSSFRARRAVRHADTDKNDFLDDSELENLVAFAQKKLGIKISAW